MTQAEFGPYKHRSLNDYANDIARSGLMNPEKARQDAEASFARHLPRGAETLNHYMYVVVADKKDVGFLWWGKRDEGQAWIYEIYVQPEFRGQGLGRATLQAFREDAEAKGFNQLALHVFGFNEAARALYRSFGFSETSVTMAMKL